MEPDEESGLGEKVQEALPLSRLERYTAQLTEKA
jgi:hypothetical protein